MSSERILVVDDEEDISELVRYNPGYVVTLADSGEEAVRAAGREPFDLLVLDLMLPGISGIEVARIFKSDPRTRNIPIIMLTARGEEADVVAGLALADDYVTKPFSARIRAMLRRKGDAPEKDILRRGDIAIDPGRRADITSKPSAAWDTGLRKIHR